MLENVDRISFELGMINCFVEMVACGVKKMAISPPLAPEDYHLIEALSEKMVKAFGIKSHLDKSLLLTDLQTEDFTKGKWAILYYTDAHILKAYFSLKKRKEELENTGQYDEENRKDISREFMRLLSYPENIISKKLTQETPESPFILIDDWKEQRKSENTDYKSQQWSGDDPDDPGYGAALQSDLSVEINKHWPFVQLGYRIFKSE